ncbi:recombinase family protein [Bradyrhizobium sp. G127]|uniref:recombinase family protein n=1 Tax=Bradyrhizobium sp. G127 TaxID=2904800 RepID=UPI0024BF61AE|nr:recombinase family protein [Bradyrhizobium sp. G127]
MSSSSEDKLSKGLVRAAEYVRMSTEHQRYSTENQSDAIRQYALQRGLEIVRTYADAGRSGLNIDGRSGLQRLLSDIENGTADFTVVVVYDISRWGRFQDSDEAASYEYRCRAQGVRVAYCAEQFENDGSIGSDVQKVVKRRMAAEYSRELSVKVFAGQRRLIQLGFRQGGPPGFGLRRHLVDENGESKGELLRKQHKSIQTDRVVLVPGPPNETELVREIYRRFVHDQLSEAVIAADLNRRGITTDASRLWTRGTIHQILINEKYIGNNVWNRGSFKLKQRRVRNSPNLWIRANSVFEPIVERSLFDAAQQIIQARSRRMTNDEMLKSLSDLLVRRGDLSGLIIDEAEGCPSSSAYQSRFGNLLRAYQLVGYTPDRDYRYIEVNRALRRLFPGVVSDVVRGIENAGGYVIRDAETELLQINNEFSVSIVIARCRETAAGAMRWRIRLDRGLLPDVTIAVRMDRANIAAFDYLILPTLDMNERVLRVQEYNGISLDAYLFDSLDRLFEMAERISVREAA